MASDVAFRTCLVCLAGVMVVVGICTQSFRKVVVTYLVGVVGIAGILLPDWDFFDRDYSRWFTPITEQEKQDIAQRSGFRDRIYPLRLIIYTTIYTYALYKWWMYISN